MPRAPQPARRVPPPTARSPPRTVCPACDPSAVRDGLQPAAQLGHLPRHEHERDVFRALPPRALRPPTCSVTRALPPACCARTATARRVPPPTARSPPRTVCPACDPSAERGAFNQPLSWDTSRVTRHERHVSRALPPRAPAAPQPAVTRALPLHLLRAHRLSPPPPPGPQPAPRVCCLRPLGRTRGPSTSRSAGTPPASRHALRCFTCAASPRPAPPNLLCHTRPPPACCARTTTARRVPPPTARSPPRTVCPACDPSAGRDGLQPAAQLGHLPRHEHELHVSRALPPRALRPPTCCVTRALPPACCARTATARRVPPPTPAARPAPCALCLRPLGRARGPSTSRSAGTPPASRTCAACFTCAASPRPAPPNLLCHTRPSPCMLRAHHNRSPRAASHSPQPAPHRVPRLRPLGRTRRPSTSRSAGTPPASRTWAACFACAASPRPAPPNLLCHTRPPPCMLRAHHNRSPRAASHSPQPAPHRVPRLRPLGSTRRPSTSRSAGTPPASRTCTSMFYVRCLPAPCAPQPALCHTRPSPCMLRAHHNRSPRAASQPAARPAPCALLATPRQGATAFNQPLSWDTSRVTSMDEMFLVRCLPARPAPPKSVVAALSPARCLHRDLAPRTPAGGAGSCASPLIARTHALLVRLGRAHPPSPPPTSCASAARGRAPPPSPPLAMARAGRLEAATEALSPRCACGRGRVLAAACTTARNMCVASTPTHRRERGGR